MAKIIEELKKKAEDVKKEESKVEEKKMTTPDGNEVKTSADEKAEKKSKVKATIKKVAGYLVAGAVGAATVIGAIAIGGRKAENEDNSDQPDQAEEEDN